MTIADDMANEAALSDSPLRYLCCMLSADLLEMALRGASAGAISERLDAVWTAAEKRIVADSVLATVAAWGRA